MVSRSKQPADAHGEILAVATRLFASRGFEGTSLGDIAAEVGMRKPSLLYHFESKEALREAVLDHVLARWTETLPRILLAATAGEDQFDAVTREIVDFLAADPDRARLIVREALDRPNEFRLQLARHVKPVVENVAGYVRRGQEHGKLRADVDPEAYLFHTTVLLVCGVAFTDSFHPLMPGSRRHGGPRERLRKELLRVAKSSLFVSDAARGNVRGKVKRWPISSKTTTTSATTSRRASTGRR
jgi:AcrR family transcriptional regulator